MCAASARAAAAGPIAGAAAPVPPRHQRALYGVQTPVVHVDPELPPAPFDVMGLQLSESLTLYDCPPHVTTRMLLPVVSTNVATATPAAFFTVTGMLVEAPLVPPAPVENAA